MTRILSTATAALVLAGAAFAQGAGAGAGLGSGAGGGQARAHAAIVVKEVSWLGIAVMDIEPDRAKTLKLHDDRGAEVTAVTPDSPAERAGLKVGDVVLEFNGQRVEDQGELVHMVRETPAGKQVKLSVWRNGAPIALTATIGSHKAVDMENWNFEMPPLPNMSSMRVPVIEIPRMITVMQNPTLGIEGEALAQEPQFAEFFGVKDGVLVKSVGKNTPAERAGIKSGDVIVRAGDTKIGTWRDLSMALRSARAGQSLAMTVVRAKREMSLTVTIEDR
jgi:serine protease Do